MAARGKRPTWIAAPRAAGLKERVPSSATSSSASASYSSSGRSKAGLRDDTGKNWKLDSLVTLDPGESKPVQRNGMAMNLRDNGDTISLIAPDGSKKDEFHYPGSQEGVLIATGH